MIAAIECVVAGVSGWFSLSCIYEGATSPQDRSLPWFLYGMGFLVAAVAAGIDALRRIL